MNFNQAGYADCASAAAIKQSPFQSLTSAVDGLRDAQLRLAKITDVIVGQEPETPNVSAQGLATAAGGLVGDVDRTAHSIRALTDMLFEDINRIERRL